MTLTTTGWSVFDPTAPSRAVTVTVTALEVVQIEQSAVHIPIGQSDETTFPTVMSSGFTGLDGTATIQAFSAATYASVIALALSAKTLLLIPIRRSLLHSARSSTGRHEFGDRQQGAR